MRIFTILLGLVMLSGCSDGLEEYYGRDWANETAQSSIKYRFDTERDLTHYGPFAIEDALIYASSCVGRGVPEFKNLIVVITQDRGGLPTGAHGMFGPFSNMIVVFDGGSYYDLKTLLRHEFIHAILWETTGNPDIFHGNGCYP